MTAHHHHRQSGPAFTHFCQNLDTVATGHRDVEQHQVDAFTAGERGDGGVTVGDGGRLDPLVAEDAREGAANALFVVSDEDVGHRPPPTGSSTTKRVPIGSASWTRTYP